ncbi:hypothetical protein B0A53_01575 [Rhodotorula sp. CCFEE 5036]|nr:hypothetical protein B0A53_01575 [Rhodotorula sp. CCFEE 5036]
MEQPLLPVASTSSAGFAVLPPPPPAAAAAATRSIALSSSDDTTNSAAPAASSSYKGKSVDAVDTASVQRLKRPASKVFRCTGYGDCNMTFSRSEHLARHVRKHTGERPFKCHCGREFSRLDNVRQHAMTVHGNMIERNQDTLNALADLHNELSVTTVQRQREAGMIVQDPNAKSRRRSSATSASTASADGKPKPRKERAPPRKRSKGDAGANADVGMPVSATLPTAAGPQQRISPYALPKKATSIYAYAPPPEPSAEAYGPVPQSYEGAAEEYPPAPIHHQQIYGAMAPVGGTSVYPGMEYYSPNSPSTVYPTPPAQHLPATASPNQPLAPEGGTSAHGPTAVQYATAEHYDNGYTGAVPVTMFSAPPPPLMHPQEPPPQVQHPTEMDPLAAVKVSLPSISALLPASFSEQDHRILSEQGPPHLQVHPRAHYQEPRAPPYQAAPSHSSGSLYYAAGPSAPAPNTRPSSSLYTPVPASREHGEPAVYSDFSLIASQTLQDPAPTNEPAQLEEAYPEHLQPHRQPPQYHRAPAHVSEAQWYGQPTATPQEAFAPSATASVSDRAGPPSERPAFEMQDPRASAAATCDYPTHRDYNTHYASSSSSSNVASSASYPAPPPHHIVPFLPPSSSSYGGSESRPSYGDQGKHDIVSSRGYATAPQYPPPPAQRSGVTAAFQHPDGATGMYGSQRASGWAPAPPPPLR